MAPEKSFNDKLNFEGIIIRFASKNNKFILYFICSTTINIRILIAIKYFRFHVLFHRYFERIVFRFVLENK